MSQQGQSTLYSILLMPVLMMVVALVADVGSLQVESIRLRWANDMALVDAVTEVDAAHYEASGELLLDPAAQSVYRAYLVPNLDPLRGQMGDGATPESVAREAEFALVNTVPGTNPFNGHRLDRPAVCARIHVPIRTGLLTLAGLSATQTLSITGDAEIRVELR